MVRGCRRGARWTGPPMGRPGPPARGPRAGRTAPIMTRIYHGPRTVTPAPGRVARRTWPGRCGPQAPPARAGGPVLAPGAASGLGYTVPGSHGDAGAGPRPS